MHHPRFIDHRGKRILYVNLAHTSPAQHANGLEATERAILAQGGGPVLLLLDVTGAVVNHETEQIVATFMERTKARIRARAVVGASGLKRRAFDRPTWPAAQALFDDLEHARDWLVERDVERVAS
jgi:hypothetical protein